MKVMEESKVHQELSVICRRTAKIIIGCLGTEERLTEHFGRYDPLDAGFISTGEAMNALMKLDTRELKRSDVGIMLKELDARRIGIFCYHLLAKHIFELAQENESVSAILRRILSACTRKGPPLNNPTGFKQAFIDKDPNGKIAKPKFKIKLLEIVPGLIEAEFKVLETEFAAIEKGKIDLKRFIDDLFSPELRKTSSGAFGSEFKRSKREGQFDKSELTQQALKGKLEEVKKENEYLKKENTALYQRIAKMEKLANGPRFDFGKGTEKSRPETAKSIEQYSAKILELEKNNYELQKRIDTEDRPLIEKYKADEEKLKSDIKFLKLDNLRLQSHIEKLLKRPLDGVEKEHEYEDIKQRKISEQEKKIQELDDQVRKLEEKGFSLEQQRLELLFEKENFDLERSRMERRIKDLEEFQAEPK